MFHFACNQSTEEQLRASFAPFGEIAEIVMPKNDDGKFKGFAFVQYTSVIDAGKVCGTAALPNEGPKQAGFMSQLSRS
jgi:RNA recognition motif-containing protein